MSSLTLEQVEALIGDNPLHVYWCLIIDRKTAPSDLLKEAIEKGASRVSRSALSAIAADFIDETAASTVCKEYCDIERFPDDSSASELRDSPLCRRADDLLLNLIRKGSYLGWSLGLYENQEISLNTEWNCELNLIFKYERSWWKDYSHLLDILLKYAYHCAQATITIEIPNTQTYLFLDTQSCTFSPGRYTTWRLCPAAPQELVDQAQMLVKHLRTSLQAPDWAGRWPRPLYEVIEALRVNSTDELLFLGATLTFPEGEKQLEVKIGGCASFLFRPAFFPTLREYTGEPILLEARRNSASKREVEILYGRYTRVMPNKPCLCGLTYPRHPTNHIVRVAQLRASAAAWIKAQYRTKKKLPKSLTWALLSSPHFYFTRVPKSGRTQAQKQARRRWKRLLSEELGP